MLGYDTQGVSSARYMPMPRKLLAARLARSLAIALKHSDLTGRQRQQAIKALKDYEIRVVKRLERKLEYAEELDEIASFDLERTEKQMPLIGNMLKYDHIPDGVGPKSRH